uniref:Peroxin-19 n=1 Tax=Amorphochlora amoebiformis TaxID=1561963 RepID=A0A7S0DTQ4_9EUKA|mmetsp:Transcript_7745/g.12012  ORF Transcript_7745/g.12012 Transcript_7745/m.12012 type:complete len:300 (+) Transcript_7745:104-1003(+)
MADDPDDLDAMLDGALAEFDDDEPIPVSAAAPAASPSKPGTKTDITQSPVKEVPIASKNAENSEKKSSSGSAEGKLLKNFQNILDNLSKEAVNDEEVKKAVEDMEAVLKNTSPEALPDGWKKTGGIDYLLKGLSLKEEDLPKQTEEDALQTLLSELEKLGIDPEEKEGQGPAGSMDSVLDQMIGKMMSKEYLYPAVKEITDKFPDFLEKNKGKLSTEEAKQYKDQYDCFKELCKIFETNDENDETTSKKVVEMMSKMQSYGPPPKEIMSGLLPGVSFGPNGMPQMGEIKSGDGQECAVM